MIVRFVLGVKKDMPSKRKESRLARIEPLERDSSLNSFWAEAEMGSTRSLRLAHSHFRSNPGCLIEAAAHYSCRMVEKGSSIRLARNRLRNPPAGVVVRSCGLTVEVEVGVDRCPRMHQVVRILAHSSPEAADHSSCRMVEKGSSIRLARNRPRHDNQAVRILVHNSPEVAGHCSSPWADYN